MKQAEGGTGRGRGRARGRGRDGRGRGRGGPKAEVDKGQDSSSRKRKKPNTQEAAQEDESYCGWWEDEDGNWHEESGYGGGSEWCQEWEFENWNQQGREYWDRQAWEDAQKSMSHLKEKHKNNQPATGASVDSAASKRKRVKKDPESKEQAKPAKQAKQPDEAKQAKRAKQAEKTKEPKEPKGKTKATEETQPKTNRKKGIEADQSGKNSKQDVWDDSEFPENPKFEDMKAVCKKKTN